MKNLKSQYRIMYELGVQNRWTPNDKNDIHAVDHEVCNRTGQLITYLERAKIGCLVLGISGGVDSTTTGMIAQRAINHLRRGEFDYYQPNGASKCNFIAMRLPYGVQRDEADAQAALKCINPDSVITVDIKPACDAMLQSLKSGGLTFADAAHEDFVLGNIKARQRMIAQYAVAGAHKGLVLGTDQAAEAIMGFFTKFGDGACDYAPLSGLTKRQVRAMAVHMGVPESLAFKTPTADLESLNPGLPDEVAYGVTYDQIDDFLEGIPASDEVFQIISNAYRNTEHKRKLPVTP